MSEDKNDQGSPQITLSAEEWQKFNEALDATPQPNEALKKFLSEPDIGEAEGAPLPLLTRAFVPDDQRLVVRGFMCGTDWEHEIGQNAYGIAVWRSERDCARGKKCSAQRGMVEVEVRIVRTVKQPDF